MVARKETPGALVAAQTDALRKRDAVAVAAAALSTVEQGQTEARIRYEAATAAVRHASAALAKGGAGNEAADFHEATRLQAEAKAQLDGFADYVLPEAKANLARAEAEAAEATRLCVYLDAEARAQAAAERLRSDYPKIARSLLSLMSDLVSANEAVRAANGDLPEGCRALSDPESAVRDRPSLAAEVVDDRVEERWVYAGTDRLVADSAVPKIKQLSDGSAVLPGTGYKPKAEAVELRPMRRIERTKPQMWERGPRLSEADIPALAKPVHWPWWRGTRHPTPADIEAALAGIASGSDDAKPATDVEWVLA